MINKTYSLREGDENVTITTYVIQDTTDTKQKRPAVVIFPGGGYSFCWKGEGEPYAIEFNRAGIQAFVATYSVQKPFPEALTDASNAVKFVREHADEFNVDPEHIFVCGSSAGGHLAASLGVFWNSEPEIKCENGENKPNGMILCYPVITSGEKANKGSIAVLVEGQEEIRPKMSLENQVNSDTPPAFLWHVFQDSAVPVENSMDFAMALRKENIPFELHVYPVGDHGLSTAKENTGHNVPYVQNWMDRAIDWVWLNSKENK